MRPDRLRLDGHTATADQERALLESARSLFNEQQAGANFRPLGTAPESWAPISLAVLDALSGTRSADAVLTDTLLRIRGIGKSEWPERIGRLQRVAGHSIALDVEMIIPDDALHARHLCSRAFSALEHGPVGFVESQDVLRSSARPELDRIISLADACRESTVIITGHTDSSGSEAMNMALSLARAETVASYLAARGLTEERLITVGAGSSEPVASNETRYGRGLNRRIEIRLREGLQLARSTRD